MSWVFSCIYFTILSSSFKEDAASRNKKTLFVQLVLEPLWALHDCGLVNNDLNKLVELMGGFPFLLLSFLGCLLSAALRETWRDGEISPNSGGVRRSDEDMATYCASVFQGMCPGSVSPNCFPQRQSVA